VGLRIQLEADRCEQLAEWDQEDGYPRESIKWELMQESLSSLSGKLGDKQELLETDPKLKLMWSAWSNALRRDAQQCAEFAKGFMAADLGSDALEWETTQRHLLALVEMIEAHTAKPKK